MQRHSIKNILGDRIYTIIAFADAVTITEKTSVKWCIVFYWLLNLDVYTYLLAISLKFQIYFSLWIKTLY